MRCIEDFLSIFLSDVHYRLKEINHKILENNIVYIHS